jgi:hypothetical protein
MRYDAAAIARAERCFRDDIWSTAPADAVEEQEIRKRWFGPILVTVFAGLPDAHLLNMAQGAAEPGAVVDKHLAAAVEWLRSWEVDYLVTVASDRPDSERAETRLAGGGYERGTTIRRYLRPAGDPGGIDPPTVEVRELSAEQTEGMSLIFAEALGLSDLATVPLLDLPSLEHWHCYAAYLDGYEVACGAMRIDGGIAMLGLDATSSEARRHGCHSALIRRRLIDAECAGCHTVVAEACAAPGGGAGAARNLLRAGFAEAGRSVAWRRPVMAALS